MLAIARATESEDGAISLDRVSEKTKISKRYLEQLAIALRHAALLRSVSGRHGGYLLTRLPKDIKIGEIVEAAIGRVNIVECVLNPDSCMRSDDCECRLVYGLINSRIAEVLNENSLADLMNREWLECQAAALDLVSISPDGPACKALPC
jgi:Rrf2 family protein